MTDQAVQVMQTGKAPTEPGWYVVDYIDDHSATPDRRIVHVVSLDEDLYVFDVEASSAIPLIEFDWGFVAQIFPEKLKRSFRANP